MPPEGNVSGIELPFGRRGFGRPGFACVCLLALLAFWGSSAPSAEAVVTPKGVNGYFGATGAEGGQLNAPRGVAVNQSNGSVYVADSSNNRISVFSSSGTFLRAFGQDVVASGPGNNGTGYEICIASNDVCQAGAIAASTGGAMQTPQGVALDASGNVYVSEQGKIRVQKFDPVGNFLLAFGKDVAESGPGNTGTGFEICVAGNGDVCKTGVTGGLGGEFRSAFNANFTGYLAIAPTGTPNEGNVLVADPANRRVQEFTAAGAFVRAFGFDVVSAGPGNTGTTFEVCNAGVDTCKEAAASGSGIGQFATNTPTRVAEDADGNVYTVEPTTPNFRVQKFTLPGNVVTPQGNFSDANLKGTSSTGATQNHPTDIAIDPTTKNVLVTKAFPAGSTVTCPDTGIASVQERRVVEVSQAGTLEGTHMSCAGINTAVNGLAMRGSTGDVYVASTTVASRLYVLNTPLTPPTVGFGGISDVTAHSATVSGFVNPNGPATLPYGLTTNYRFEYKRSIDPDSAFTKLPAVSPDVGRGTSNLLVSLTLSALEGNTSYDVRLAASRSFGAGSASTAIFTFATPAAPAEVGIPSATTAVIDTNVRAALWGSVTPNSNLTTYRFEYGTSTDYGTKVPASEASAGSGTAKVPVTQFLSGLQPDTTYHFRIVAKNVNGTVASPDRTFTTPPLGGALPDNRAAELVSPADKGTAGSVSELYFVDQVYNQASEGGNAFVYPLLNGTPTTTAGGWLRLHANRTPSGWLSSQISAPSLIPPPSIEGLGFAVPSRVEFATPDLSCAIVRTYNPLTEDTLQQSVEEGIYNLYRWHASDGSYDLITDSMPLNPSVGSNGETLYTQLETSDDCSRVYFRSTYQFISGASGLYEWDEGVLRDAGKLPDGAPEDDAVAGGEVDYRGSARWNAVSPDGNRFFFAATRNEGPNSGKQGIFMREDSGETVIDITQSQTSVVTQGARFEAASPDGSRVLFRANYGIAANSSVGATNEGCGSSSGETVFEFTPPIEQKPCDLYAYDVESGDLTDLSADENPADPIGAAIQGTVAIDEDGSHVYFAALGQLIPGKGKTYAQNVTGPGSANIYLSHPGSLSYVTTLSRAGTNDLFGPGDGRDAPNGVLMRKATRWTAETTPDGSRLLFEASANLADYNSGGFKEAYLYSAETGELSCVSCRLDGLPSQSSFPDRRLVLPRQLILSHRANAMSEDGSRIFFTSPNALAIGGVAGKNNVYEWQDGKVQFLAIAEPSGGNGMGEYLDASASGDDVFIATKEQLAPQDVDLVADVYDLRVDGGFPVEPPLVPCQVDEAVSLLPDQGYCQGPSAPQPPAPGPASAAFQGTGNTSTKPKPKPCRKGKVRRQGKCVKRQKQGGKRKQSRAAHTNRGGAK
ncbi:MAG TPA: hypothetical protein VNP96_00860 [Solirubrobacterales bacterium]|nr:hypothetical protein [Solirubrobacterales bacterium]